MKYLVMIFCAIFSVGLVEKTVEASTSDSVYFVETEDNVKVDVQIFDPFEVSFLESRADVRFSGTAAAEEDLISPSFPAKNNYTVTFDYVSPQTYDVPFSATLQRWDNAAIGWVNDTYTDLTAKASSKTAKLGYALGSVSTSSKYRIVITTDMAYGVKITNGKVTY